MLEGESNEIYFYIIPLELKWSWSFVSATNVIVQCRYIQYLDTVRYEIGILMRIKKNVNIHKSKISLIRCSFAKLLYLEETP